MMTNLPEKLPEFNHPEIAPDFEISVLEHDVVTGAIPVTWCIGKELRDKIQDDIKDYFVAIITSPLNPGEFIPENKRAEWRTIVPLKDMVAYLTFLRPGASRIFASLVHKNTLSLINRERFLMKSSDGGWQLDVLSYYHQDDEKELIVHPKTAMGLAQAQATCDIDMPKECFAKPPPAWLYSWGNLCFPSEPTDQCAFRRRLLFAFSAQIPLIILAVAVILVVGIGLWLFRLLAALFFTLFACRGIDWEPIYRPLADDVSTADIWINIKGSHLYFPKLPFSMSWMFMVAPFLLVSCIICYLFGIDLRYNISMLLLLLGNIGIVLAFLVAVPLTVLAIDWLLFDLLKLTWLNDHWLFRWMEYREDRTEERAAWKKHKARQEAALLACQMSNYKKVGDLPRRKRTLRLRFTGTKAKVCRPFPKT